MRALAWFVVLACLSCVAMATAQKWRFVVAGDGRSSPRENRPEDRDGINVKITTEIANAVIAENAKFLMWTGDLVVGYTKTPEEFEKMLLAWRKIMEPVYAKGIKVLPCRGNHDAGGADGVNVWSRVFSGKYALPQDGPKGEKNLTFSYRQGDVLVLGLDQYGERKETIDQAWLDSTLKANKARFVFAMGHEPAFMDGAHKDTMDADEAARDAFWNSLMGAGSRVFFAGHDHLYDHMTVRRALGDAGPEMHQIVAGTAGAPFYKAKGYTGKNANWKLSQVKHIEDTYGYVVVEINGNRATITFKGRNADGKYVPMDAFSYTAPGR